MTEIDDPQESLDQRVRRAQREGGPDAAIDVLEAALREPKAEEVYWLPEVLQEIAELHAQENRWDAAIQAVERAIAAGAQRNPDPRADIAGYRLRAGRVAEAREILRELRAEQPDDVWPYNRAAMDFADAGLHDEALQWDEDGLRRALRTGDPERLADQLRTHRLEALTARGDQLPADVAVTAYDDLDAEARTFVFDRARAFIRASRGSGHEIKAGRNEPCPCGSGSSTRSVAGLRSLSPEAELWRVPGSACPSSCSAGLTRRSSSLRPAGSWRSAARTRSRSCRRRSTSVAGR